jgi:hypothetical protein
MATLSSTHDSERGIRWTVRQAVEIPVCGAMSSAGSGRLTQVIAATGLALGAVVFWPGVVDFEQVVKRKWTNWEIQT